MSKMISAMRTWACLLAMAFAAVIVPAIPAQAMQGSPTSTPVSLADGYVLGPGDVIEVALVGREDYKARVQVQSDGTIQLPFLNTVTAADRTVLQLRGQIATALKKGGFFNDPIVSITIATYASRYVVVLGDVASPGVVPIDRAYRTSEILARVGGLKATASEVLTLRRASGEELQLPIEKIAVGSASEDPVVEPGDKLYVATAPTFYIYGQVKAPGTFKVSPGMTLRMALAQGGGLTDRGSEKRIKVFRGGQQLPSGALDTPIMGGDVIVAGERFF